MDDDEFERQRAQFEKERAKEREAMASLEIKRQAYERMRETIRHVVRHRANNSFEDWAKAFCDLWKAAEAAERGPLYTRIVEHYEKGSNFHYLAAAYLLGLGKRQDAAKIEAELRAAKSDGSEEKGRLDPLMDVVAQACVKLETFPPDAEQVAPLHENNEAIQQIEVELRAAGAALLESRRSILEAAGIAEGQIIDILIVPSTTLPKKSRSGYIERQLHAADSNGKPRPTLSVFDDEDDSHVIRYLLALGKVRWLELSRSDRTPSAVEKLYAKLLRDDRRARRLLEWSGGRTTREVAELLVRTFVEKGWTPERVAETSLADLAASVGCAESVRSGQSAEAAAEADSEAPISAAEPHEPDPLPAWQPTIPPLPAAIGNLTDEPLRLRTATAWTQGHTLLAAIDAWTEWVAIPSGLGMKRGDEIARAGRTAIETLRRLGAICDALRPDTDTTDPEIPGVDFWWPEPPSEMLDLTWYTDRDRNAQKRIDETLFFINHLLKPALRKWLDVLGVSPDAAMGSGRVEGMSVRAG